MQDGIEANGPEQTPIGVCGITNGGRLARALPVGLRLFLFGPVVDADTIYTSKAISITDSDTLRILTGDGQVLQFVATVPCGHR